MKLKDLRQYLGTSSREQLIAEIGEMFSKIDAVKDYYQSKLNLGYSAEVSEKYKSVIKHEFFPARGFGRARLSMARKAVSDYKKVTASKFGAADMMLYYVEVGVQFTNTYGDIDEAFTTAWKACMKGLRNISCGMGYRRSSERGAAESLQAIQVLDGDFMTG